MKVRNFQYKGPALQLGDIKKFNRIAVLKEKALHGNTRNHPVNIYINCKF